MTSFGDDYALAPRSHNPLTTALFATEVPKEAELGQQNSDDGKCEDPNDSSFALKRQSETGRITRLGQISYEKVDARNKGWWHETLTQREHDAIKN